MRFQLDFYVVTFFLSCDRQTAGNIGYAHPALFSFANPPGSKLELVRQIGIFLCLDSFFV